MAKKEAIFITKWKAKVSGIIKMKYDDIDDKKLNKLLDEIIGMTLKNPKVGIINNYLNKVVKTDVLSLIDTIDNNNLIIGGSGVLYQPHGVKENPLIHFIMKNMSLRSEFKKLRKNYDKGTDEWSMYDILQLIVKILINTLYGVMGYPGFILFNLFIAESITNQGKQIVCTAVESFENFLEDAVKFSTTSEMYEYISNIHNEYEEKYKGKLDIDAIRMVDIDHKLVKRIVNKCAFDATDETILTLEKIVFNMKEPEKYILYYKNNMMEFNQLPFIKDKYEYIINNIDLLTAGELWRIKDEKILGIINDLWAFYEVFVFYNYPVYDRLRKAMYIDKKNVLYVDTDSNFVGIANYIEYITSLCKHKNLSEDDAVLTSASIMIIFMSNMINASLFKLAKGMNVSDEYAKKLNMKNELYLDRILFTTKKKRYISNAKSQEGQILGNGLGMEEIKGFEFIKSTTKPFVKEYFTKICLEDILRAETINVEKIYKKLIILRQDIESSMKRGESKYFKQANVKTIDNYKKPYSTQGITAILVWNTLNPQYAIELPTDVDIVPIKELTFKKPAVPKEKQINPQLKSLGYEEPKGIKRVDTDGYMKNKNTKWFAEKHPETFELLKNGIYNNPNELIRHMGIKYIAKPKNENVPIPDWFGDLIDTEKIVVSTLGLFTPILESLGLKNLKTTSTVTYPSNMIDL